MSGMERGQFLKAICAFGAVLTVAGCGTRLSSRREVGQSVVQGRLSESGRYENLHPRFSRAFSFLRKNDLRKLSLGRHVIDGSDIYANVIDAQLKKWDSSVQMEAHRRYIDIQVPITGDEVMGFVEDEETVRKEVFNEEADLVLIQNANMQKLHVFPGEFVAFFPPFGAHAAGLTDSVPHVIRKIVVKVRV